MNFQALWEQYQPQMISLATLIGCVLLGLILARIVISVLQFWAKRTDSVLSREMVENWHGPLYLLFPLLFVNVALPGVQLGEGPLAIVRHVFAILVVAALAWFVLRTVSGARDVVMSRYRMDAADNLAARKVFTQLRIIENIVKVVVYILAIGIILMTFETFRQAGTAMLASAGIAGIILGFAAQKSIGVVLAGLQLALTQPIRIDDVVIVEGEWGRIEEISLTYVVVRIWDQRRLIVPSTYFLENAFQNWTRTTADILGTVYFYVDYSVPVDELREELKRLVEERRDLWDGKVVGLVATNATEKTMELRALVGAPDSGKAWDLRCYVREKLLQYIRENHPESLPRLRAEFEPPDERETSGAPPTSAS